MFSLYFLLVLFCNNVLSDEPVLKLAQGKVQGSVRENFLGGTFYSFQGIPYAKPPVGPLRFKSPEPAEPWKDVWNGTTEGPKCTQGSILGHGIIGQEDCLYLNVYIPNLPPNHGQPKAVMVLLHGGGYIVGDGGEELFSPNFIMSEDIIFVAMNYRLNIFGFLSFEDPSVGVYGNMGLKDQVMGLKWVQENIESFGGDPNKVTIFGESAGGASVNLMLLSPLAKGLFQKAIAQSGVPILPWVFTERRYKNFATHLKFAGDMENQKEIFDFLNSKGSEELVLAQLKMLPEDEKYIAEFAQIGAVLENPDSNPDAFITKDPLEMFKDGEFTKVPMIMGFTQDEGVIFWTGKTMIKKNFKDNEVLVPKHFNLERGSPKNKEIGNKIKEFYFGDKDKQAGENTVREFIDMMTDISFSHGILKIANIIMEKSSEPLYFYLFNYISELNYMSILSESPIPTACHADDNGYMYPFLWSEVEILPDSVEMRGIHRMVKLWTTFAKMGDPNEHGPDALLNIPWPKAYLGNFTYLVIQDERELRAELIPEREKFWTDLENSLGIK